jgi:GMP synthase-like glutamine amidotransferase
VPTLGVCLGSQLLVKAIGGSVFGAAEPEKGWTPVELTDAAESDPVFGALPRRFHALNWHVDTWTLPDGDGTVEIAEIARSDRCPQAFRIGDSAWGVQFHPEVRRTRIRVWLERDVADDAERDAIWRELEAGLDEWEALGKALCAAFVRAAERRAA